jgi:hypothetical protein
MAGANDLIAHGKDAALEQEPEIAHAARTHCAGVPARVRAPFCSDARAATIDDGACRRAYAIDMVRQRR